MIKIIIAALVAIIGGTGVYMATNSDSGTSMMQDVAMEESMMEDEESMMEDMDEAIEDSSGSDTMMDSSETMMNDGSDMMDENDPAVSQMVDDGTPALAAGTYAPYTATAVAAADEDVVLFFKASWCPTCRTTDADIKANAGNIPETLTILEVDYDQETDLKRKYGVTLQHTFVQVDNNGNLIKKWSGSPTLTALVGEVS